MSKLVSVPNLGTVEFPDDTPDEAISSSITDHLDRVGKKAALGEEMAATRRERFAGDVSEKSIKGAEFFTQGISKMFPTSAIGGVMDALGVQPPIPAEHVRQAREFLSGLPARAEIPAGVPTVGPAFDPGVEKGVNQFVDEMVSGLTRPDQVALLAASGKFPTEVARTFQLAPVVEAPQQIQQVQQASEAGDVPATVKGIAGLTAGALLPSAIEAGINKPTPIERAGPNARAIEVSAKVHGDLQSPPITGEGEVPTSEGVGGIQSETPGGIPATPESAQPARPREENQVPLNEQTPPRKKVWRISPEGETYLAEAPPTEANTPASVPSTETAGVSETAGGKSGEAKAPVTAQDIAAMTPEEFKAFHDAIPKTFDDKGIGADRAAVNDLSKSLISVKQIADAEKLVVDARKRLSEIGGELEKQKDAGSTYEQLQPQFAKSMMENQRVQFLDEAVRTAKARQAVEGGMSVQDAVDNFGVHKASLESTLKAVAPEALPSVEPAKAPEQVKPVEVAKPVHKMDVFRGSGRGNKQSIYTFGIDEPVLGKGNYYALDEKTAKKYGPNVENQSVSFSNPLKISSDEDYVNLIRGAGIKYAKFWQTSPEKIKSALQDAHSKIRKYLADNGYDAVVVKVGDIQNQVLDDVFSHDQVFIPEKSEGAKSEPVKANGKKSPVSKQAELTFEEQKAEQAELNKAQAEEPPRSYTSATEDESGRLYLNPIGPLIRMTVRDIRDFSDSVKKSAEWIIEKGREAAGHGKGSLKENFSAAGKANDFNKGVLNWSMKEQKSFGDAARLQRDIFGRVPDSIREEAVVNWIQAGGDDAVLAHRAATTTNKRLKKGYELARQLTPEELQFARDTKAIYDILGQRAQAYGVLNTFRDNYVTQAWKIKNIVGGAARTLKDRFKYAKARTFDSFYDGEQAGFIPKTKQLSKLLPAYLHEMNSVIAAKQLVKELQSGVAPDGREILVPKGEGTPVSGPTGDATLITPKSVKGDTSDYKVIPNQPALSDWTWAAKDTAGNNIFLKADLAVHPKYYHHLKNILSQSAIREWYKSDTGASAMIPKMVAQTIDQIGIQTKRTMFGLLAPFHQVQEGFHGLLGHRVNAFSVPEIDLSRFPEQADAAKHGLMLLPDRASESQFMDGFRASGVISHIPLIGTLSDAYSRYLFHDYIPGIKFDTYKHALARNLEVFAKDIASGKVSVPDVKITTAQQVNAAYGHLNYALIGRNPTIAHILRAGLVAPDFFEARIRFTGQAAKGALGFKIGREGILALGLLALSQATMAYTASKMFGGQWDYKHPFEMTKNGKRYTMRSIPEDIASFIKDPRRFLNSRMSPGVSTIDQLHSGLDYKHERISTADTLKEAALKPLPLTARAALHMGPKSLSAWEQLAGSFGLKISAADPKVDKAIELKDRTALLSNKLRKLNRIERYKTAKDELKDLPPKDRNTVIDKLRRQGVFTYQ